jgi:hypothetical protein
VLTHIRAAGRRFRRHAREDPDTALHEGPPRQLFAEVNGRRYEVVASLADARMTPGTVVILDGDHGGQIYVSAPIDQVGCDEATLARLLSDLDSFAWESNGGDGAGIWFERRPVRSGVPGGMGGAHVEQGIWVHEEFEDLGVAESIRAVVRGERDRMAELPSPSRPRFDGTYVSTRRWPGAIRFESGGKLELPGEAEGLWELWDGMLHLRIEEHEIIGAVVSSHLCLPSDPAYDARPLESGITEYRFVRDF